ncbi:putative N-acetyltransferase YobR [Acrocarpospora phusangensis]|uniref:N-acetyltransferase YobR n=1 Tax=Acrocarpospora phusangensis TaxID=1070424 RepID=A0A919Q9J7_9ACTN|nr:GNAT family N-acetyltransferase [Acrocarpospora phusangensis]GIH24533.1 putative N-acetyltransferase YobR [Acrocarpospora phusangensis]
MDDIETFDRLVHRAWPAPEQVTAGSWIYRYAAGVTKRANSVLPLSGTGSWDRVDAAERFYRGLGAACVFSIGPGAEGGLDAELAARGYRTVDPTLIMTAETAPADGADVADTPSAEWFDTWWEVDGGRHPGRPDARDWARRILTGVQAGYASAGPDAVGRGVVQGEWLGVYCMAVRPSARRKGNGTAVLRQLLGWGHGRGARRAYLVVTEANAGARALYEQAGFVVSGGYHYRVSP